MAVQQSNGKYQEMSPLIKLTHCLEKFRDWISTLAFAQNRLYYRDQTPESLNYLVESVQRCEPTKIVELGTLSGLSLRTWLSADTDAEIIAIDLSFNSLHQSQRILPLDLSRVKLIEENILKVDFSQLWKADDRVLLYVDAHDQPNVPIMVHILNNAVPLLPSGSVIIVDDLWYSPNTLSNESARQFFENGVSKEIDNLQCFEGYYANYWKGGSFFGFREVIPLMEWVNQNQIELVFDKRIKVVTFNSGCKKISIPEFDKVAFDKLTGSVRYNPLDVIMNGSITASVHSQLFELGKKGIDLYAAGKLKEALECFQKIADVNPSLNGVFYAQAIILARKGQLKDSVDTMQKELLLESPHSNVKILLKDISELLKKKRDSLLLKKKQNHPITIFTIPKAFDGHIDIIQRNAIKSWTLLNPQPEIILFGDENGTAEIAQELGLCHIPVVKCNEYGTPLINDLFAQSKQIATHSILSYVNADIILLDDFMPAVNKTKEKFSMFLMVGQRWDVDIHFPLNFRTDKWQPIIREMVSRIGSLHSVTGIDYFVFTKDLWHGIPAFAVGRTAWDNWLVHEPLAQGTPVVDATQLVMAVHQNHDYFHLQGGRTEAFQGKEAMRNKMLAGERERNSGYISDATWQLTKFGISKKSDYTYSTQTEVFPFEKHIRSFQETGFYIYGSGEYSRSIISNLKIKGKKLPDNVIELDSRLELFEGIPVKDIRDIEDTKPIIVGSKYFFYEVVRKINKYHIHFADARVLNGAVMFRKSGISNAFLSDYLNFEKDLS